MFVRFLYPVLFFLLSAIVGFTLQNYISSGNRSFAAIVAGVFMNLTANLLLGPFSFFDFLIVLVIFVIGFYLGEKIKITVKEKF